MPVRERCADPDHPEDWWIEPGKAWEFIKSYDFDILPRVIDPEAELWTEPRHIDPVSFGYVRRMAKPSTLILMKAPESCRCGSGKKRARTGATPENPRQESIGNCGCIARDARTSFQ